MIRNYRETDSAAIYELWQEVGTAMGYAPLSREKLDGLLLKHPDFSPEHTFVWEEAGDINGFVNGCTGDHIPRGDVRGYVTCLLLKPPADTQENTEALLGALEQSFRERGRQYSAVTFFNPIRLPWILPGTENHQHNNVPGVATDLALNGRMQSFGYREATRECAMYRSLADFSMPGEILEKEKTMAARGYTVAQYDPRCHRGLEEMLAALENPLWCREISEAGKTGMRLLVGLCGNTCAGFTGPIYPEKSGRGYFSGIGVAPEYGHQGLGTLLFYRLLQEEKAAGAAYMSLFTGETNPAKKIYEGAGFRTVRTFSVMLKEL